MRLPVIAERSGPPAPGRVARGPAIRTDRPLVCVAASGGLDPALRFVSALAGEWQARGCPWIALVEAEAAAQASARLRAIGASQVAELARELSDEAWLANIRRLPTGRLMVGIGAEIAARLSGLLTVGLGPAIEGADLELRAGSEEVASAIGAWLAQRWSSYHPKY